MYTLYQQYDSSKTAFINPQDCVSAVSGFPARCVSTFSESIIERFAQMDSVRQIASLYTANGALPVYQIRYRDTDIAFYLSRVGAPACVVGFEEVVAMGAQKFVLFGSCGVLNHKMADGQLVVPTAAVREEGVSHQYLPAADEIQLDPASIAAVTAAIGSSGYPFIPGKVWTTDAPYRETAEKVARRKSEGCIAVEMECAAMAAAAQFRGIPFAQFLYAADTLDAPVWQPRSLCEYGLSQSQTYMALAFECALRL